MYFPGDPLNDKDFIYRIVPADERERVIGQSVAPADAGEPAFRFDIIIRGRFQTPPDVEP